MAKTRTQRRMEKRQAIILLVLVLAVSLASFTLGVIVGRRGAERDLAHKFRHTEKVLVAQAPAAVTAPIPVTSAAPVAEEQPVEPATEETKLSFYDNLAKEAAPLGSGINLAPVEAAPAVESIVQPPINLPAQPIVQKTTETVAATNIAPEQASSIEAAAGKQTPAMPKVVPAGSHAVQVGSFNSAGDAIALKQKLLEKDYPAFVTEADLGDKGLWYRVRIGPYANATSAKKVQETLEEKEQLKGFVSRQ
ncbi:MAG: SPOR domain-containing protein [Deltaproteobacteria bacterium]|nr:SPOR domain-containing protein [Deltaproteobacteria bacterium]MCW9049465.1 SPOR domain-containing protein [Deltaproteobacteria bacterium]